MNLHPLLLASVVSWGARAASATVANSTGMKMIPVGPGEFDMGQREGGDRDERPAHRVTITAASHISATEVTNAQYEQFDPSHRELRGRNGLSAEDDEAVIFVSWHDAVGFCAWLSEREGKPYRLPTEAEWEYACRAGTDTPYSTGESLPEAFHRNQTLVWQPKPVSLRVGRTPPNPWGLFDMHGNVEEWCYDWYGPYEAAPQRDPVGRESGDFRVTRGGSHSTQLEFLRSANRSGALPEDKSWMIGFRVVMGELPRTAPLPVLPPARWARGVRQVACDWSGAPDPAKPYFRGPMRYVRIPPGSNGPLFSKHNHCPALVNCPNGDLLAIWYTCRTEPGRELGIAASRLRRGASEWGAADSFWDTPDRNDHASAFLALEDGTLIHFNGVSAAATWGSLATVMRTSTDSGATWSRARLIMPEHGLHHMPVESAFRMTDGTLLLPCDAVTGGNGGTAVLLSRDNGTTWRDPGEGKPQPAFSDGGTGAWVAGIHAALVQLKDGRLMAHGRGDTIEGRMPRSISADGGETWTYGTTPFPPIGGGQRAVLLRLRQGPIFFASFAQRTTVRDETGTERAVSGLFAALSYDEGETWPVHRLVTDDGPSRRVDGGGNTGVFVMGPSRAEPRGYLSVCQTPDDLVHLISSKQYYSFNLAWLEAPMPEAPPPPPPPEAVKLPTRTALAYMFAPTELPSKDRHWRFTGSGPAESTAVSFGDSEGMRLDTGPGQRCRWMDDGRDGFAAVDEKAGVTAEIRLAVTRSTARTRGIDFEIGIDRRQAKRYFITITRTGVYWYDQGFHELAEGLDNAAGPHTFRFSTRADGVVQVYRDGVVLGLREPSQGGFEGRDSYLQWGEGAGASEADAVIHHVGYDLTGAYAP